MNLNEIIIKQMSDRLLTLCRQELELDQLPEIIFVNQDSVEGISFGVFDGAIKVVIKNRHPVDVMRTLAHELVHWKQRCENLELNGSDGSYTEDQANAIGGTIMRKFGRLYPEYFSQRSAA